ncbi:Hsp20/alpha crystallin family protein [Methylobacterium sp. NEAU K]|uniref:Hsp20/alpha crystallin family protein n=1 Tax=Methylobacterium sp. NEAU K TaxID=3064946 RepID=UPI002732F9C0|nr:Hsp20/alpha crystallin family protein [Methylobacterium sp. NEAU K]MDP4002665.1 Hsp20/alpha crystallin family protein [Methylobacterium sp. NEAU K]
MAESGTELAAKGEKAANRSIAPTEWRPFETLRRDVDLFIDDLGRTLRRIPLGFSGGDIEPIMSSTAMWHIAPVADIVSKAACYEITAELPGMDDKNIQVKVSDGMLTIRGEKKEEKEEKKEGYYLSERRFGSFERSFRIPPGANADKIEAVLKNGVLTVTLPKTTDAKAEKTVEIKAA